MKISLYLFVFGVIFHRGNAVVVGCTAVDLMDSAAVASSLQTGLSVTCSETNMTIEISSCIFDQMGYDSDADVGLNGPDGSHNGSVDADCQGSYSAGSHTISWSIELDTCDTAVTTDADYRIYSNVIRTLSYTGTTGQVVAYRYDIAVDVNCQYYYNFTENIGPIQPTIEPHTDVSVSNTGVYAETVSLCEDMDCTSPIMPMDLVPLLDVIYVVIEVTYTRVVLQFVNIWATPSDNPNDATSYDLVVDGCPEETFFTMEHHVSLKIWFCFPVFHWVHDFSDKIYIHVDYILCDQDEIGSDCTTTPSCNGRRRRSLANLSHRNLHTKTIGPIKVQ